MDNLDERKPSLPDCLLKPEQAAAILSIPVKAVHELCRRRQLGFVRINRRGERRFTTDQLTQYIRAQTVAAVIPVDRRVHPDLPFPRKGGETKKSVGVEGCGLLTEEIKKLCQS